MILEQLLERLAYTLSGSKNLDTEIKSIEQDSRKVQEGSLFVAVRGTTVDGHSFIPQVMEAGAAAIVCDEEWAQSEAATVCKDWAGSFIIVKDCNLALAMLASAWNGYPSEQLTLVGVTGTNGKTTIATLLYKLFTKLGYPCGLLSTVCNYVTDRAVPATHTTPDPLELNDLLRQMVEAGCAYAFMEVSSHSADQKRIGGLDFDGGIFTNLTRDHMDYHKTVENYLKAKKSFFDGLKKEAFALSNLDDKNGEVMLQNTKARKRFYSVRTAADYQAKVVEEAFEGMELQLNGTPVVTHFVGRFNASNLVAVYGAALELGAKNEEVLVKMSELVPVNGRFESIRSPKGFSAIIDYAHTPDALINVLGTIREILDTKKEGKVITVVGCGGNRDKGKRPIMAKESALRSDRLILTSDNPRFEEPEDILKDMEAGLDTPELRDKTITIVDRREAIRTAILLAQKGDVILIAGKGHEDYQDVKGTKHHFDDHEVVREAINL
ncbi:MAG: UDP-N-acetylmuramoyl-L-alanyl-D-glutamate--2,6-diaminopimelate ligase [Bacteroidales bacterium]|nr:UDP-N-acetylmuramoyl-L-alanyl-D-glutamate--2,6-diaminopimelate ligase [Bacteroidales bacterium]